MKKDTIFSKKFNKIEDFSFDQRTAEVFDNMLERSVPFYWEIQRMIVELAGEFVQEDTGVYDLGCSTGTTLLQLGKSIKKSNVCFVGLDYSEPMLDQCRKRFKRHGLKNGYRLERVDLNDPFSLANASLVILNLTLQFVRPVRRLSLLKEIYQGLNPGGCLILVEKVVSRHTRLDKFFVKAYHTLKKRNGYSDLEIAQKEASLQNILKKISLEGNMALLSKSGFKQSDVFFKWNNFSGIVAVK